MSKTQKWWLVLAIILSIAAIIFSTISLCNSNERYTEIDYIGVVGSVLGATATVLVGWQIYSVIKLEDISSKYNQIDVRFLSLERKLRRNSRLLDAESAMLHGANYITWVNNGADISALGTAYILLSHALKNFIVENQKDSAAKCLILMKDCLYEAHDKDAWDKIFNDEVNIHIKGDNKVLLHWHFSFYPDDAILYIRIRDSQEKKKLCTELLKQKEEEEASPKEVKQSPTVEENATDEQDDCLIIKIRKIFRRIKKSNPTTKQ